MYSKFNQVPSTIVEFIRHDLIFQEFCTIIDNIQLNSITNEDKTIEIENFRNYINLKNDDIKIKFMKNALNSGEAEKDEIFYNSSNLNSEIESKFRKYSIYFHPDKMQSKNKEYKNLSSEVFSLLLRTKQRLQQNYCTKGYFATIKEAEDILDYAIDFYYAWRLIVTGDIKFKAKWKYLRENNILETNPNKTYNII